MRGERDVVVGRDADAVDEFVVGAELLSGWLDDASLIILTPRLQRTDSPAPLTAAGPADPAALMDAAGRTMAELMRWCAEPDPSGRGLDQGEREKPTLVIPVDREMGDGTSGRADDHATHLAAGPRSPRAGSCGTRT